MEGPALAVEFWSCSLIYKGLLEDRKGIGEVATP